MRLAGKRAVITGAASGIGRSGAELFAREGAALALIDIDSDGLKETAAAIQAAGGVATAVHADLSDREQCRASMLKAIDALGGIDVLWLHAGVAVFGDFEVLDLAAYDRATEINISGPVVMIGEATKHFRNNPRGGSIVFTASISGLVGSTTSPIYSTHKFGVVGMTMSLAQSLAAIKVRVNAVCPGHINTPMLTNFLRRSGGEAAVQPGLERIGSGVPMGRVGEPEEIAHAALWLASDDASYVTGVALPVDGGYTCK